MSIAWLPKEEKALLRAVKKAASFEDAIERAAAAVPNRAMSLGTIQKKLQRMGEGTLSQFVARNVVATPPKKSAPEQTNEEVVRLRLEHQVAGLEKAKNRLLKEIAGRDEQIRVLAEIRKAKPLKPIVAEKRVGATQRRGMPFGICSDWHVEEQVDPKKVNGMNAYDLTIAERCIESVGEAFEWLSKDSRFDAREALIALIGDLFSGYIHEELEEGNFLSPVKAVVWLLDRLEKMLRSVAANMPEIERFVVVCRDGNHGRLTHRIRAATRSDNSLEWLMFHTLAARMANDPRFVFRVEESEWTYVEVYGKTFAFTHGDQFSYQGGVGGVLIPVRRKLNEIRKYRHFDHVSMGHFHTRHDFEDITINGSMIGVTPYSIRSGFTPEPRRQSWFMVDSERGKSTSAPIWLPKTGTI
jgi:hypothetical protein